MFKISNPKLEGISWMVFSCFCAAWMVILVRHLSNIGLHPFQIAFFRNAVALALFIPWVMKNGIGVFKTRKLHMYSTRAIFGVTAMFMWFYALSIVPLAQSTALSFTSPLFSFILAVIFLKERHDNRRMIAMIIGFSGTIIILRPGLDGFTYTSLFVLVSASMWSISAVIIKTLAKTEKPERIVFFMVLLMTPLSLPPAIPYWQNPDLHQWFWILVMAVVSNIFQITMTRSMGKTDLTILLPFDFTRLIFVSILSYFIFNEKLDLTTYIGAAIILGSACYIGYRESLLKKPAKISEDALGGG